MIDMNRLEGENYTIARLKERLDVIAALLSPKCPSYQDAVATALKLVNEVDRQVDKELQTTPAKEGL